MIMPIFKVSVRPRFAETKNNWDLLVHIMINLNNLYAERFRSIIYEDNTFLNFTHSFPDNIQQSI